jgi:putative transcriptional regulator
MVRREKQNEIERDLIDGLEGVLDTLKKGGPAAKKLTVRRVALNIPLHRYSPHRVRATRNILRVSQVLFARFLGVSPNTVRAWEAGKPPSDMARRFMDEIHRDPEYWRRRLRESTSIKAG